MNLPALITQSLLYKKLASDIELEGAVTNLRAKAESLAGTLVRDADTFTDHTIRHMDALWLVAEKILTVDEIQGMTSGEAFLLATGFYFHDIGMSYAATSEGRKSLEQTPDYAGVISAAKPDTDPGTVRRKALAHAIRIHHARVAQELAIGPIPGTTEYLLEPKSIRDQFGAICGQIAASHHWSVDRVEAELGAQEIVPMANNRTADLGFVAGALRLIDYAHINRERAPPLDRAIRPPLVAESAVHWDAQQNIDGPSRAQGTNELVYSSSPLADVDAWWLIYEFARGLDQEIAQVRRFLKGRKVSSDRLSLVGVRGANSPEDFGKLVKTNGFLPLAGC